MKAVGWILSLLGLALLGLILFYPAGSGTPGTTGSDTQNIEKLPFVLNNGIFWFTDTGDEKPVRFNHFDHQRAHPDCRTCHDSIFLMEPGSTDVEGALDHANMGAGLFCGRCHNGRKAFSLNEECEMCHLEKEDPEK
ncbi:MAG: hypothetical protein OEY64_09305 [Nitrospinota bacterium]|nr:hypothetical protein [Nitrospinota bacterium]